MKKVIAILLLLSLILTISATDQRQKPGKQLEARYAGVSKLNLTERYSREIEFVIEPQVLLTTYYDYMPGSYNGSPLRKQSSSNYYAVFHAQETSASNRRMYYSYIEADGSNTTFMIGSTNTWEGYGSVDIDPVTDDPMAVWHADIDPANAGLEVPFTYDLFHLQGPGSWINPYSALSSEAPSPSEDDEFIWPYVYIGPSPEEDMRRVYVYGSNSVGHGPDGNPSENVLIGKADFNTELIEATAHFNFTYATIPEMDAWNAGTPDIRPFKAMAASEDSGELAFIGYHTGDSLFVFYNDNYGEDDWMMDTAYSRFPVENPQNEDGSYVFTDTEGNPEELYFGPINSGNFNAIFSPDGTKICYSGTLGLMNNNETYYPLEIFPYFYYYDIATEEFHFNILEQSINENATNPNYVWSTDLVYLPWDTDNDGEVDEFDSDGNVVMFNGWPCYNHNTDEAFNDNQFYTFVGEDGSIGSLWIDGLKNYYAQNGIEGYTDWVDVAEIKMNFTPDGGNSWFDTISLNANETEELGSMHPAYVYPGDIMETMGSSESLIHLLFLDDDQLGGQNSGGNIMHAAIKTQTMDSQNNEITPEIGYKLSNYPNPFNPTTTIIYSLPDISTDVEIEIYNIKGQKVRSIAPHFDSAQCDNSVIWDGTDLNQKSVASGIYFYKLTADGKQLATKKMMLIK